MVVDAVYFRPESHISGPQEAAFWSWRIIFTARRLTQYRYFSHLRQNQISCRTVEHLWTNYEQFMNHLWTIYKQFMFAWVFAFSWQCDLTSELDQHIVWRHLRICHVVQTRIVRSSSWSKCSWQCSKLHQAAPNCTKLLTYQKVQCEFVPGVVHRGQNPNGNHFEAI